MRPDSSTPRRPFIGVNLLRAHGSPTHYFYNHRHPEMRCRCACCRAENAEWHRRYREQASSVVYVREHNRQYHQAHRSTLLAASRRHYQTHRKERLIAARAYAEQHREQRRATESNREARKRGAKGSHTASDVLAQYARQHGRCYWCPKKVGSHYHVDHVIPLALGGSDGPENIVIACPTCNMRKGSKHPMDYAGRFF